jgi:Glycosyltransferases, probably involved in cell wall biogenesis
VIIPVYNAAEYLARCLDSLVQQSFQDIEVFLVDDGSTDESLSICRQYEQRFSIFFVLETGHHGQSHARNRGICEALGEWIFFLDADDELPRDSLAQLAKAAGEFNADIVCGNETRFFYDGSQSRGGWRSETVFLEGDHARYIFAAYLDDPKRNKIMVNVWNKLYRRSLITANGTAFKEDMCFAEDGVFLAECIARSQSFVYINEITYIYYHNQENIGSSRNDIFVQSIDVTLRYLKEYLESKNVKNATELYYNAFSEYTVITLFHIARKCNLLSINDIRLAIKHIHNNINIHPLQLCFKHYSRKDNDNYPLIVFLIRRKMAFLTIVLFKFQIFIKRITKKVPHA